MNFSKIKINSENILINNDDCRVVSYDYDTTEINMTQNSELEVTPITKKIQIKTDLKKPDKLGVLLVGLGGNNGTTVAGGILANQKKITWRTKENPQNVSNYFGSVVESTTVRLGNVGGQEVFVPFSSIFDSVCRFNDVTVGGWDMSSMNIGEAMKRASVFDIDLQNQLYEDLSKIHPMRAIYDADFIASNQEDRVDNVYRGLSKKESVDQIRRDICEFRKTHNLDKIVILWTANTERYTEVIPGVNDTAEAILSTLENGDEHNCLAPSTLYAIASILEGVPYINGSPQNTFVPGVMELAMKTNGAFIGGDDFKSGQTKMKSLLVDFLVSAGIAPRSIVSYNHLGNNDGKNLANPLCFRSKEISKSDVVNDILDSNKILYPVEKAHKIDHTVVIKYVPYVGDSKRALDEYTSEIFMNGKNTIVMHNTCEDSLLAAPIILDLCVLMEYWTRLSVSFDNGDTFLPMSTVCPLLSYFTKAPLVPKGSPCINALSKQRMMLENLLRASVGLRPENHMLLEFGVDCSK